MIIGTPDFILIGLIGLSIVIGIFRGFIRESISLISWISAIILAIAFANPLSVYMTFTDVAFIKMLSAFLIIFVSVIFVGAIFNLIIGSLVRKTPFSMPDRILGSLFGLARGVVFITVAVLIASLTPFPEETWWKQSYMLTQFQKLAVQCQALLPEEQAKLFQFTKNDDEQKNEDEAESEEKIIPHG